MEDINIPENIAIIESVTFSGCSSLKTINIPNSVTSLGESAFASCLNLSNINIPTAVTSIENSAFYNCKGLSNITVNWKNSIATINTSTFKYLDLSKITLIVPNNTKANYKAAKIWNGFNIVENSALKTTGTKPIDGLILNTNKGTVVSNLNNVIIIVYIQVNNQNLQGVYIVKAIDNNRNITITKMLVE